MGKAFDNITPKIQRWIERQHMFFVATAPLSRDASVNLSPKGIDTLRIIDENTLAFMDWGGSGVETISHLRENGRIVIMMCAFAGPSVIYRFHGRGRVVLPTDSEFDGLAERFDRTEVGVRSIIVIDVTRVSDSCGYGVPFYDYKAQRKTSGEYVRKHGEQHIRDYLGGLNERSIDGLPGLSAEEAQSYQGPIIEKS